MFVVVLEFAVIIKLFGHGMLAELSDLYIESAGVLRYNVKVPLALIFLIDV